MVATINTMILVAVHNNPSPTSVTTNLNPTVISTGAIAEKQRVTSQETTSYPFPLNIWRRLIRPPAGGNLFTRSISETLTLTETSVLRKITRKLAETLTLSESPVRKPIPKITGETLSLAEAITRKTKPLGYWFRAAFTYN